MGIRLFLTTQCYSTMNHLSLFILFHPMKAHCCGGGSQGSARFLSYSIFLETPPGIMMSFGKSKREFMNTTRIALFNTWFQGSRSWLSLTYSLTIISWVLVQHHNFYKFLRAVWRSWRHCNVEGNRPWRCPLTLIIRKPMVYSHDKCLNFYVWKTVMTGTSSNTSFQCLSYLININFIIAVDNTWLSKMLFVPKILRCLKIWSTSKCTVSNTL